MKIALLYPSSNAQTSGNAVTAERWQTILSSLGHAVEIGTQLPNHEVDVLISLNALKTGSLCAAYTERYPSVTQIFVITGTDIHGTPQDKIDSLVTLDRAKKIICINPYSKILLPRNLQSRTVVILQSAPSYSSSGEFLTTRALVAGQVLCVGHLRDEKDPFLPIAALELLPNPDSLKLRHFGQALTEEYQRLAQQYSARLPYYQWFGEVGESRIVEEMRSAQALVISSRVEGAPAVISEAVTTGLPILATSIPGCVGLLGEDYPGLYPVGNAQALSVLLNRLQQEPEWYQKLEEATLALQPKFDYEVERRAFASLLESITS